MKYINFLSDYQYDRIIEMYEKDLLTEDEIENFAKYDFYETFSCAVQSYYHICCEDIITTKIYIETSETELFSIVNETMNMIMSYSIDNTNILEILKSDKVISYYEDKVILKIFEASSKKEIEKYKKISKKYYDYAGCFKEKKVNESLLPF